MSAVTARPLVNEGLLCPPLTAVSRVVWHKRLWTVQDVAEYLGVPVATLYDWRCKGYGPKGKRVGRYLRYEEDTVRDWFAHLDENVA